jgi:transposase
VRKWVVAFDVHGPAGLLDGKAPGHRPLLNPEQCEALRRIVEAGPNPATDGVVRWRLVDLAQWVYAEFRISISKQTLSRMLRAMGYRKLSARPRHHAQDPAAPAAFKKALPRAWRRSGSAMRPAGQ